MTWPSVVASWGSTAGERAQSFACDRLVPDATHALFRAVDVDAPADHTFRWLCQLRAAPYSYDRIDNLGRRSPQELVPGLDQLAAGQRVQTVFKLVEFEPGRSMTMQTAGWLFGRVACTYRADRVADDRSRIVVKLVIAYPERRLLGRLMRWVLPAGDLIMMRRQLLNLKRLTEGSSRDRAHRD